MSKINIEPARLEDHVVRVNGVLRELYHNTTKTELVNSVLGLAANVVTAIADCPDEETACLAAIELVAEALKENKGSESPFPHIFNMSVGN